MVRVALLGLMLGATGCGRAGQVGGTIHGRVTEGAGAQARLAGPGSVGAVATVTASAIGPGGLRFAVRDADVHSGGSFAVDGPGGEDWALVQVFDASGELVGSVIVEPGDDDRDATPIDTESSVEAEVFLLLDADARAWGRVRAVVDQRTALAVRGSADVQGDLVALCHGIDAATETEARGWADVGVDSEAVTQDRIASSADLSADLFAGSAGAYDAWLDAFDDASAAAGADARQHAEVEAQASLAFRVTLDAAGAEGMADASAGAVGRAEARAWGRVSHALLESAGASQATLDAATTASASLSTDVEASASASAAASAVGDWRETLVGSAAVEGSLLGDAVGPDLLVEAALDAAVEASAQVAASIDASASASADAALSGGPFDAEAVAQATVDAWASERAALQANLATTLAAVPHAQASADLVIAAHSAFAGL